MSPLEDLDPTAPPPHRLVRADAGTGKTYRLTLRFLELLARGHEPSTVLAATFTRKAAGEILERVLVRLAGAAADRSEAARLAHELGIALSPERLGELLASLCASLDRVQIGTLDAYFHRVASAFRYELGMPRFQLVAGAHDPILEPLRHRALGAALDELEGGDVAALAELIARLYRGDAQRSLLPTLDRIVAELHPILVAAPQSLTWSRLEPVGRALEPIELEDLLAALAREGDRCSKGLRQGLTVNLESARRGHWEELFARGIAKKLLLEPDDPHYRNQPISEALHALYQRLIGHGSHFLLTRLGTQTVATHRLLDAYERHFEAARRGAGVVLFGELVARVAGAGGALLDPEQGEHRQALLLDLFFRLDARLQHLLLDEFQDTSVEQWQALLPVFEEALSWGDGSHSVFVVGDPKQSIYGWRGGCAELFGDLEERFRGGAGAVETLRLSYRSSPVLLDVLNQVFADLPRNAALLEPSAQRAAERWSRFFEPHSAVVVERPGYFRLQTSQRWEGEFPDDLPLVQVLDEDELDDGSDEQPEARVRPANHLDYAALEVREIAERLAAWPDRDLGPVPSIGVLTLTNRTAREVLELLLERGVAASGEGGGRIDDDPAVALVLSALRLAAHPGDRAAAFHLAHSPFAEMLGLSSWRRTASVSRQVRRELARSGVRAAVAEWARRLAPSCDPRGAVRLQQLLELIDRIERAGVGGIAALVRQIEQSSTEEPSPAAVRVMTVHKAKGLEFDAVVLCELERAFGRIAGSLLEVGREHALAPIDAIYRSTNQTVRSLSAALEEAHRQEVERRVTDELGVLYVALTRARYELHVLVQPVARRRDGGSPANARSPAGLLRAALLGGGEDEAWAAGECRLFEAGEPPTQRERQRSPESSDVASRAMPGAASLPPAAMTAQAPRRPRHRVVLPSELTPPAAASGPEVLRELLDLRPLRQRWRGALLHAWLCEIEWQDAQAPLPDRERLANVARRVVAYQDEAWLLERMEELARTLERPEIASVFARPREKKVTLWRERPFAVTVDDAVVRGTFDRVVLYGSLGRFEAAELYELKSDRFVSGDEPASGHSIEQALAQATDRYRPQVEAYRAALARIAGLLPTGVRAQLVFLDAGRVIEL